VELPGNRGPSVVRTRREVWGPASAVARLAAASVAAVLARHATDAARDGLVTLRADAVNAAASAVRRIAGVAVLLAEAAQRRVLDAILAADAEGSDVLRTRAVA